MRVHNFIEGPHDPYINRAVFMAGVPGAGKSYIARKLGSAFPGVKQVNPDIIFKYLLTARGLSHKMPDEEESERELQRYRSKDLVSRQQQNYIEGGLGMFIDTTARAYDTVALMKKKLEDRGYDTMMLFVDADLGTALARNQARDRTVPERIVRQNWDSIQRNKPLYRELFGYDFVEIDNSRKNQDHVDQDIITVEKRLRQFFTQGD